MGFNGDLYPTAGASVVMTTSGDMVKYQSGARTRLGIGSANQILQVKSSLPSWETVDLADTVLTTAGDVLFENATPELARLPKGTQYNNLQMGSALPAWSASSTSVLTGTGDVLYSSGANTLTRLGIGSTADVLTVAGGVPSWSAPAGGGSITKVDEQTSTGGVVDITGTFTAIDLQTNACAMIIWRGALSTLADVMLRWNGIDTVGSYSGNALYLGAGNSSLVTHSSQDHMPLTYNSASAPEASPNLGFAGVMYLYSYENPAGADVIMGSYLTNNFDGWQNWQCQNDTTSQTELDEFRLYCSSDALIAGTQYTVYKITQ